MMKFKIKIT